MLSRRRLNGTIDFFRQYNSWGIVSSNFVQLTMAERHIVSIALAQDLSHQSVKPKLTYSFPPFKNYYIQKNVCILQVEPYRRLLTILVVDTSRHLCLATISCPSGVDIRSGTTLGVSGLHESRTS